MIPYKQFLDSLTIGQTVKVHYDGKAGRHTQGVVVGRTFLTIKVEFVPWANREAGRISLDFAQGEAYDKSSDINLLMFGQAGDLYVLGPK